MSLEISVFVNEIDDSIIPKWLEELNQFAMKCEIDPTFTFENHSGFLPFHINIYENTHEQLLNRSFLSGFELYIENFNIHNYITPPKKQTWLDRLFNKPVEKTYFVSPEIDERIKLYKYEIGFRWGGSDTFSLRMSLLGATTLAKVTNGLYLDHQSGELVDDINNYIKDEYKSIIEYEIEMKPKHFDVEEFKGW